MRLTENYGFEVPQANDFVDPDQYGGNFDAIDGLLKSAGDHANDKNLHFDEQNGALLEMRRIIGMLYGDPSVPGADLSQVFAAEIGGAPFSGDFWAWIKARVTAGNFAGLYVGDFIPFTAGGNAIKAEIAGINTYKRYSEIGNHIDFISRDCWPDTHVWNKINYNNGLAGTPCPWLVSDLYAWLNSLAMNVPNGTGADPATIAVDYTTSGVLDKLPAALRNVIVQKRVRLPQRYTAGSLLIDDNNWLWQDAGKLWVPSEFEVYGCNVWGSGVGYSLGGFQQYPIFAHNMRRSKNAGEGGSNAAWWLLSARGGSSTSACIISGGTASQNYASTTTICAPLCFRIA
ncbi:MAG: hypothetical protein FWH01_17765 [Oscillospiraceae bacterium]|nr:hypothetical protein [Oscillospiraceae bacterium]